jgi:hypothetical protein
LCIPAGIPGIPLGFFSWLLEKRNMSLFRQERLEKAEQTIKEPSKTHSFFGGTIFLID